MAVIAELLCVPEQDREELRLWADDMVHRDDRFKGIPPKGLEAAGKIAGYFDEMLQHRKAKPGR